MIRPRAFNPAWMLTMVACALLSWATHGRVVINEILYHAPGDLDDLEFIELHNTGEDPVDLSGWKFSKGLKFTFPAGTRISPAGFILLCRDEGRFRQFYPAAAPVVGTFASKLSNNGERLELSDAQGRIVDTVKYQDASPWPLGADGLSGSLERICPDSGGDNVLNWASSPLSADRGRPGGSPGQTNAVHSAELPPAISLVRTVPEWPQPGQPFQIEARVRDAEEVTGVELTYRIARSGVESAPVTMPMVLRPGGAEGLYAAALPPQTAGSLVRYRIRATGAGGAVRLVPAETEPRPSFTAWVRDAAVPSAGPALPTLTMIDPAASAGTSGNDYRVAVLWHDPAAARSESADYARIEEGKRGYAVEAAKGHTLGGMAELRLEAPRHAVEFLIAPLAHALLREAGLVVPECRPTLVQRDGRSLGVFLAQEVPAREFYRRARFEDQGVLVKGAHKQRVSFPGPERSARNSGSVTGMVAEFPALLEMLAGTGSEDRRWEVVRRALDVERVLNLLAVHQILASPAHPDAHYAAFLDAEGTGRWSLLPRDLDASFGGGSTGPAGLEVARLGLPAARIVAGDPATEPASTDLARILMATPAFRALCLARLRELLESRLTEQRLRELIAGLAEPTRTALAMTTSAPAGQPGLSAGPEALGKAAAALLSHLTERRRHLLAIEEVRQAGPFTTTGLEKPVSRKVAKAAAATPSSGATPAAGGRPGGGPGGRPGARPSATPDADEDRPPPDARPGSPPSRSPAPAP